MFTCMHEAISSYLLGLLPSSGKEVNQGGLGCDLRLQYGHRNTTVCLPGRILITHPHLELASITIPMHYRLPEMEDGPNVWYRTPAPLKAPALGSLPICRAPSWGAYDSRTPSEPYGTGTGGHGGGNHQQYSQQYNQQYNPATQYAPAGQHGVEVARAAEHPPPQAAATDQPPPAAGGQTATASPMPVPAPASAESPVEGTEQQYQQQQQQQSTPPPTVVAGEVSIINISC